MKKNKYIVLIIFAVIGLITFILTNKGNKVKKPEKKSEKNITVNMNTQTKITDGNYLIVAQGTKPKSLDPHKFNDFSIISVTEHVFNTLVTLDDNRNVVPELAEAWEYITPQEIIFKIRKNVKFHNGELLTANDVVFSLKRMINEPSSYTLVRDIENVEKIDDFSVKVTLKNPSAPFLYNLSMPLTAILNEKAYKETPDEVSVRPIGTGPFKVKEWGVGERVVLDSFKDYFKGAPKVDGVIFKTIAETTTKMIALETGEVDLIYGVAPIDFKTIESKENLTLFYKNSMTTDYLVINTNKKYLDNLDIRKAIHYAINKQGIIDAIYLGRGHIANSPVNPLIFGSYQNIHTYSFNPEKSKEILANAGIKPGEVNLKIWCSENPIRVQIAQIIQENLKNVGINAKIEIVETGTYLDKTAKGEHDISLTTWIQSVSDADSILTPLLHSKSIGFAGNRSFFENKKLDKLLDDARMNIDEIAREELYKQVQEIISEENPIIPLVYKVDGLGMNKRIKNFSYNQGTMRNYFELVEKEKENK